MKTEGAVLILTLLLMGVCSGHVISKRRGTTSMTGKLETITENLKDLIAALAELDRQLSNALSVGAVRGHVSKRSSTNDDDSISCRLSLHEDVCQAFEMMRDRDQSTYLSSGASPGKRSGKDSATKYRRIAADLTKKRDLLHAIRNIFNNAGHVLEREKKWFTCNLNLGFTCQTQEYSAIADYYDFLNSADSPGKKRSAPNMPGSS